MLLREGWQGFPEELWDEYDRQCLEGLGMGAEAVTGVGQAVSAGAQPEGPFYGAADLKAGGTD
jgi:hypothetical protein